MNFFECISRIDSINSQHQIALSAFDLYQKKEETSLSDMIEHSKHNKANAADAKSHAAD